MPRTTYKRVSETGARPGDSRCDGRNCPAGAGLGPLPPIDLVAWPMGTPARGALPLRCPFARPHTGKGAGLHQGAAPTPQRVAHSPREPVIL